MIENPILDGGHETHAIDPELQSVVDAHLKDAFEYLSSLESGLSVEDEIELFRGNGRYDKRDISDDSIIMRRLSESLLDVLAASGNETDYGMLPGKGSNQAVEIAHGAGADIVFKYEFGEPGDSSVVDTSEYSLSLAKPGKYTEKQSG